MLGGQHDAEDVTQEALLRAYRALATYDSSNSFRTWLFAILVNRCRTSLLQRSRYTRRVVTDEDALQSAVSGDEAAATELRIEIERAVAMLEPDQREAFLLKHVEQLGYDEMAAVTGAGVSALKMRVKRACERLQELLGEVNDVTS
jgi:RNA polymerase sigma-70 factor (ECF subfamily)